jgi:Ca-activated chloride channel family protein
MTFTGLVTLQRNRQRARFRWHVLCVVVLAAVLLPHAGGQAGVLIPRDRQSPDPSILSLDEMRVQIEIDNGDAHVHIVQIFASHTGKIEEGTYRFALPSGATVSDFAVWDGPVRIPAVILERRRAQEIYAQAKAQAIDPGLLEAGEREGSNPQESAVFTAQIVPIAAYGTKRLELDYHQRLPVTEQKQYFVLPLKPGAAGEQIAAHFSLKFVLHAVVPFSQLTFAPQVTLVKSDANSAEATMEQSQFNFTDDFKVTWAFAPETSDQLSVITHRDPRVPLPTAGAPLAAAGRVKAADGAEEPGFFEAQLLLAADAPTARPPAPSATHRTLILLFDNSLSMQWDKLERSYAALEATLHALGPDDRFNVLLFNQGVTPFQPEVTVADPVSVQAALKFVRASRLRGGTDVLKALTAGLAQVKQPGTSLVLFTDGGSDRGETVLPGRIAARYSAACKQVPHPPHTAIFAVGDDANMPLLKALAHQDGFLEPVLSTEPLEFHLQTFLAKLRSTPVSGLALSAPPAASLVYALDDAVYPGSEAAWVGRYAPAPGTPGFSASAIRAGSTVHTDAHVALPALDRAHPQLPRLWAQARVDALLAEIDRDGESAALIDEIIRLSRRYKFVTPYTSFLAVPRALLRPRVIRPGDPVLRVRTDPAIVSVIALFPFGLTKPLRHLASEDLVAPKLGDEDEANRLWETRFLAPPDMRDGTYQVRLILRDRDGNTYNEQKSFVIASTPPTVTLHLGSTSVHRGEVLEIRASASQSTRTLTARLDGVAPVTLRWNQRESVNTGMLAVPVGLPVGRYTLRVTAEDLAHNLGTQEVPVEVLP